MINGFDAVEALGRRPCIDEPGAAWEMAGARVTIFRLDHASGGLRPGDEAEIASLEAAFETAEANLQAAIDRALTCGGNCCGRLAASGAQVTVVI